jgi:hypothetical protein
MADATMNNAMNNLVAQQRAEFDAILIRIGFSPAQREAVIDTSGCINVAMIGLLTTDQITKMCKRIESRAANLIIITTMQEQFLLSLRHWVVNKQRLQEPVNPNDFTLVTALNQTQLMQQQAEDEAKMDREIVAKAPDKFKLGSSWKVFAEALETYLGQLLGSGRVPLKYVIRRTEVPTPNALYQTKLEQNTAMAPLTGEAFPRDNAKVYGIIKQLVLEGPGRSYILPYDSIAGGRQAWLALRAHYEGEGFRNRNVDEAYTTLEHLFYEGEKKGFTFEKFLEKHNECFLELEIRDFLTRIIAPELQAAVQTVVRATENLLANFQAAANFIALSVKPIIKPSQQVVIAVQAQNANLNNNNANNKGQQNANQGRGCGGRGRGKGRGRGRGGRGGCGYHNKQV